MQKMIQLGFRVVSQVQLLCSSLRILDPSWLVAAFQMLGFAIFEEFVLCAVLLSLGHSGGTRLAWKIHSWVLGTLILYPYFCVYFRAEGP